MADTYRIVRNFLVHSTRILVIKRGLTLEDAQAHCRDPEASSRTCRKAAGLERTEQMGPWFDSYDQE